MNIAIIGAGASGLFLTKVLNKNISYTIFNKGKVGRKILASGNGRCNISNFNYDDSFYHHNPLANIIVKNNQQKLFDYFKKLNIYTKCDDEGRMYPISESSLSILNILTKNIKNIIDIEVTNIEKKNNKYYINNEYGPFDKIIISIGSNAQVNDYNFNLIKSLNIKYNEFKPSLVGFITKEKLKEISGVRSKAKVSLLKDNNIIHTELGEVIFKDDGISGICIMNLSSFYQKTDKLNMKIKIDLIMDGIYNSYDSVLNPKLLNYINKYNINPSNFILNIKDTYNMEFAQVASGGIDINELNKNLTLKNNNDIYLMGEVIDVDGLCGGYNLMFAFTSAIVVGSDINEISNK